jgi:hypothetical protein
MHPAATSAEYLEIALVRKIPKLSLKERATPGETGRQGLLGVSLRGQQPPGTTHQLYQTCLVRPIVGSEMENVKTDLESDHMRDHLVVKSTGYLWTYTYR